MSSENDLRKRLKALTLSLWKTLECSICLSPITTPFKQCIRGHMNCSKCITTLAVCPTCKGYFAIENPVGVKNFLEALPKVCQYEKEGCEEVVEHGDDHETYCGHRKVACRDCNTQVSVDQIVKHYETKHRRGSPIGKIDKQTITWKDFSPDVFRNADLPIFLFDTFFWITVTNDIHRKQLLILFQVLSIGKPEEEFYVNVRFEKGNHLYGYSIKAFMVENSPDNVEGKPGVDCDDSTENRALNNMGYIQTQYCMSVPQDELKRFIDATNVLSYKIHVFKEKVE